MSNRPLLPLRTRLLLAFALLPVSWCLAGVSAGVEPLHRIRESRPLPASHSTPALGVDWAPAQPTALAAGAEVWLNVLVRWLHNRRGPVAWTGSESLGTGQPADGQGSTDQQHPAHLDQLGPDDEVVVRFGTDSCYARVSGELRFNGRTRTWRLSQPESMPMAAPNGLGGGSLCRQPPLADEDVGRLQRLIEYWRRGGGSGCAQVLSASVQRFHAGKLVAGEEFQDAGCAPPSDSLDLVGLWMGYCQ